MWLLGDVVDQLRWDWWKHIREAIWGPNLADSVIYDENEEPEELEVLAIDQPVW